MIRADDFIVAEYSDDLTAAGITVSRADLYRQGGAGGERAYVRLRRQVAGVAVGLAFRRYLSQQGVEYRASANDSFNSAEVGLRVGGNRWHLNSYLISRPDQVAILEADLGAALATPALIPLKGRWRDGFSDDDVHVFAMCTGVFEAAGMQRRSASPDPAGEFLMHLMPSSWANPQHWVRMGPVVLKSESPEELIVELAGHNEAGEFVAHPVRLGNGRRREVGGDFWSVTHIHARSRPTGRVGINREWGNRGYVIDPDHWTDVWIHGRKLLFLGWMRHGEFRHRARTLPAGSRVFQFNRTRNANMSVPVADLKPLSRLLDSLTRSSPAS